MAALEAISSGVPLVCTDVGGLGEIIRHTQEGLLVERTPAAFAAAIIRLGRDTQLRREMQVRCRMRWQKFFSADVMESRYRKLYEALI